MARHKHADVIHAYAEGAKVQRKTEGYDRDWVDTEKPSFSPNSKYRVKPEKTKRTMSKKHEHYDCIVAWAEGKEIEYKALGHDNWHTFTGTNPDFDDWLYCRVKPKIVKREGWVNIYKDKPENSLFMGRASPIYKSKEQADIYRETDGKICIRIEWEEEV